MRSHPASIPLVIALAASLGCMTPALPGPSSERRPSDTRAEGEDGSPPDAAAGRGSSRRPGELWRRGEAATESAIIGTVLGSLLGPAGAAVGAGLFGFYGLFMGRPPIDTGAGSHRAAKGQDGADAQSDKELDAELERRRQQTLEEEIEAELRRQEELLEQISRQEEVHKSIELEQAARRNAPPLDPLAAPPAPAERELPDSIFDRSQRKEGKRSLLLKTLDADRDGHPEIEIAYDEKSGALLWRREDTDYDGLLDAENLYDERGRVTARNEDTNHDGQMDRWTRYADGRAARVEVDRDGDDVRDGFYVYRDGWRAFEEHDTNNDGKIDRRVEYAQRRRTVAIEDRDLDGRMEIRTFYGAADVPERTEIDRNGDGKTDVWEHYEGGAATQVALTRKEEDVNGDGRVDVTSYYAKGKLVRKEVADPSLVQ